MKLPEAGSLSVVQEDFDAESRNALSPPPGPHECVSKGGHERWGRASSRGSIQVNCLPPSTLQYVHTAHIRERQASLGRSGPQNMLSYGVLGLSRGCFGSTEARVLERDVQPLVCVYIHLESSASGRPDERICSSPDRSTDGICVASRGSMRPTGSSRCPWAGRGVQSRAETHDVSWQAPGDWVWPCFGGCSGHYGH